MALEAEEAPPARPLRRPKAGRSAQDSHSPPIPEWRGSVAKHWVIVEHFQRDGEEFIVARRRVTSPLERLTRREREIVLAACTGRAIKVIAFDLGISTSTAGVLLWRAETKLGVRSRRDLARLVRTWEAIPPADEEAP